MNCSHSETKVGYGFAGGPGLGSYEYCLLCGETLSKTPDPEANNAGCLVVGTHLEPGKYDCYAKLEKDEPHFVLKSTDSLAPELVEQWALLAVEQPMEKRQEALKCARDMREWKVLKDMKDSGLLTDPQDPDKPDAIGKWHTRRQVEDVVEAAGMKVWRPAPHFGKWAIFDEEKQCFITNSEVDEQMGV